MEWPAVLRPLFDGAQSALAPAGRDAEAIARLSWIMFGSGGVIFAIVMLLLLYALVKPRRSGRWLADRRMIIGAGIAFPIVVLSALLTYGLLMAQALVRPGGETAARIEVTGEQFWWRVRYLDADGQTLFSTANEIRIPVGRPVRFTLLSGDVIHSFWIPSLGGKLDMIPGRANSMSLTAERAGVYRGQCAEFCGGAHALMAFYVVAEPPEAFAGWLRRQAAPAPEPADPLLESGKALFLASGCGSCHTVRGTAAAGVLGPDLTHVGSRISLGAALLPNNRGTLAGWIASSQHLKPRNRMPSFDVFDGRSLRAIAGYLESLE